MCAAAVVVYAAALAALSGVAAGPCASKPSAPVNDARAAAAGGKQNITKVHVIWSNHLDVGFTGQDYDVWNSYFEVSIPRALWLAKWMNSAAATSGWDRGSSGGGGGGGDSGGGEDRFVFTTHAYVLSLMLDCPPAMGVRCPGAEAAQAVREAVRAGVLTWHAAPFNLEWEVCDEGLAAAAVDLVHALDAQFGLPPKITLSLRDVPGLTRAAVPVLARRGVRALSVGVNWGSAPPGVPKSTPFLWRDPASGEELVAMWHQGGYGGWNHGLDVGSPADCVTAPGWDEVLCYAWRCDNAGPPMTPTEVVEVYAQLRRDYPGAQVVASTFDDYTTALLAALPQLDLPVVTSEIGDTWVYGIQSDPIKISDYRAAARARTACVIDPSCDSESPAFLNFTRLMLKIPEHTWGVDVKTYIATGASFWEDWASDKERKRLRHPPPSYKTGVESWERQRAYLTWALQALPPDHPVTAAYAADVAARDGHHSRLGERAGLARLWSRRQDGAAAERLRLGSYCEGCWSVEVDPASGALTSLVRSGADGAAAAPDWAAGGPGFASLVYEVYNEADFAPIWSDYAFMSPVDGGFVQDLSKWHLGSSWNKSISVRATLEAVYGGRPGGEGGLLAHLRFSLPAGLTRDAGAPPTLWAVLAAPPGAEELALTVVWVGKPPTRLPEALWLRVQPGSVADPATWELSKLGSWLAPGEVMLNGSYSMHAVGDEGVRVSAADLAGGGGGRGPASARLQVRTLDAALVSPGAPMTVFPNVRRPPDMTAGVAFNLFNNAWGTNYIQWYPYGKDGVNATFRFGIRSDVRVAPQQQRAPAARVAVV